MFKPLPQFFIRLVEVQEPPDHELGALGVEPDRAHAIVNDGLVKGPGELHSKLGEQVHQKKGAPLVVGNHGGNQGQAMIIFKSFVSFG